LSKTKADPRKTLIWLSMGTEEGEKIAERGGATESATDSRELRDILKTKGFEENENLIYYEEPGGRHSEKYWARLMPKVLEFLLTGR